jgi:hypothetical protein
MEYCCEAMARWSQPCEQHKDDPMACPDRLIHHTANVNMPGIRIFDGGSSFVVIAFCPWCGKQVFDNSGLEGHRGREGVSDDYPMPELPPMEERTEPKPDSPLVICPDCGKPTWRCECATMNL